MKLHELPVRVVRLMKMDEPVSSPAKLAGNRRYAERNRERLAKAERERYHARKGS